MNAASLRVLALASFAFRTSARMPLALVGLAAGVGIMLLGGLSAERTGGWLDPELAFYGYLVAALFALRSGLEEQREAGLRDFLWHNLATPAEHALAAALALMAALGAFSVYAILAMTLVSGGDLVTASWYAWVWGLRAALLLPFVLATESLMRIRLPLLFPVLLYLALLLVASFTLGEDRALALFGTSGAPAPFRTSLPHVIRATLVMPPGIAVFVAMTAWVGRRRGTAAESVPFRHGGAPHDTPPSPPGRSQPRKPGGTR